MSLRQLALVAAAVLVPVTLAAPAYAVDHIICVNDPAGVTCDQSFTSLHNALLAANASSVDSTVRVAPGIYSEQPYTAQGTHHVTLQGSGQGSTVIQIVTTPSTDMSVTAIGATVEDLTITMGSTNSDGDIGLFAVDSTIQRVTVQGPNTQNTQGIRIGGGSVSSSTITMTRDEAADTRGIVTTDATTITDTSITASAGYHHASAGTVATLSRVSVKGSYSGISVQAGSVVVDDALVELDNEPYGVGLLADDQNGNPARSLFANHVTIVGGGFSSVGVRAWAYSPSAVQDTTVHLDNSIVFGPSQSLDAEASNNGSLGANSTATITTAYSLWSTQNTYSGTGGTATITSGAGHVDANPSFRNPAGSDYRLTATSPVIDAGDPGTSTPTLDLDGQARVLDGNGDGAAVRDMGAYEAPKKDVAPVPDTTAPNTTLTAHPRKRTTRRRASFGFAASEAQVTFQCRIDKKAWASCTSPRSYRVTRGWHVFTVRARDAAGNLDATPAMWRFKRV